jgi:plastocyanin
VAAALRLSIRHSGIPGLRFPGTAVVGNGNFGSIAKDPVQAGQVKQEPSIQRGNRTMTRNKLWFAGLAVPVFIAMLLLFAASPRVRANDQSSAANAEVKIDNFVFGPQTLTVPVGATVTWTNKDDIPHTTVSTDGVFKSKVMDTDEKFSYTFTEAGTFSYYCSVHPKMTGKVVVQ